MLLALPVRAEVEVLASIRPLALIAAEVVGKQGRAEALLPAGASPHDYPMRVSDMRRLAQADLVLWVGADLETFLRKPLARLPAARRLTLGELDGLHWPGGEAEHTDHDHGGRDPHLWLDPRNGALIARALAERLAQADPPQASAYRRRARALGERLAALDERLADQLAPVSERPFAVYHEGYAHFVERYGLNQRAVVTRSPEQRPGARHLYRLRQRLTVAHCLFIEPYYDMGGARQLAEELGLRLGEVDPLGARKAVGSYPELLERMAADMSACLAPE